MLAMFCCIFMFSQLWQSWDTDILQDHVESKVGYTLFQSSPFFTPNVLRQSIIDINNNNNTNSTNFLTNSTNNNYNFTTPLTPTHSTSLNAFTNVNSVLATHLIGSFFYSDHDDHQTSMSTGEDFDKFGEDLGVLGALGLEKCVADLWLHMIL